MVKRFALCAFPLTLLADALPNAPPQITRLKEEHQILAEDASRRDGEFAERLADADAALQQAQQKRAAMHHQLQEAEASAVFLARSARQWHSQSCAERQTRRFFSC